MRPTCGIDVHNIVSRAIDEMQAETENAYIRISLHNLDRIRSHYHREQMRAIDLISELCSSSMNDGCIAAPQSTEDYEVMVQIILEQVKKIK